MNNICCRRWEFKLQPVSKNVAVCCSPVPVIAEWQCDAKTPAGSQSRPLPFHPGPAEPPSFEALLLRASLLNI